jgi:hypothetical protein
MEAERRNPLEGQRLFNVLLQPPEKKRLENLVKLTQKPLLGVFLEKKLTTFWFNNRSVHIKI